MPSEYVLVSLIVGEYCILYFTWWHGCIWSMGVKLLDTLCVLYCVQISEEHVVVLQVIGYVGVSISIVCMIFTIIALVALR